MDRLSRLPTSNLLNLLKEVNKDLMSRIHGLMDCVPLKVSMIYVTSCLLFLKSRILLAD